MVTDVLRVVYLLETTSRRDVLRRVSAATKLSRLYCVFLAGEGCVRVCVCVCV